MTLLKYFVITNVSLIMFAGSFAAGFMVGNEHKIIYHNHLISYIDTNKIQNIEHIEKPNVVAALPAPNYNPVSDDEFECLSKTIYFEAGNQSYYGKIAVGSVVMNRVNDDRYPDTICGVITQHKQFSWYSDGKSDVPFDGLAWENSIKAAKEVLCGCDKASGLFDDASVQYYHADYVSPSWAKKMKRVAKIDNHIFYR